MFGLEIAAVGLLHFTGLSEKKAAAAKAQAESAKAAAIAKMTCDPINDLDTKIEPTQDPLTYDFSKSRQEVSAIGEDLNTYSPYGAEHKLNLLGLTVGKQSLHFETMYTMNSNTKLDMGCVHIKKLTVKMKYKPKIYVINEFPKGTCEFNEVLKHEKRHVQITQKMLNKYSKILGKNFQQAFRKGYSFGPFKTGKFELAAKKLDQKIDKMTQKVNKAMNAEMEKHQNAFDRAEKSNHALQDCSKTKNSALKK